MASPYELELTLTSAKQLKNVNWRHGTNKPYAVVYIDPIIKFTTNIDQNGDRESQWKNQTLILPLPPKPIKDLILYIQIVHAGFEENTKKLIGLAQLKGDILDETDEYVHLQKNIRINLQQSHRSQSRSSRRTFGSSRR
ncbi:hypothetical protein P8452_55264 [Trifolium repens]|nr:hypothetical protein P8452_55264 [Trifolium repens]